MPKSNLLILCHPLLLLPSIFPSIRGFSSESALRIRWPEYWGFRFSISPSNEYSGLISFRIDWFDHIADYLNSEESWAPKNWCFWTVVLERTLESPLDCREIKPVNPKGTPSLCSLEGLMLKLNLPGLGPPDAKDWLIGKDPDAGKFWRQEEKGMR